MPHSVLSSDRPRTVFRHLRRVAVCALAIAALSACSTTESNLPPAPTMSTPIAGTPATLPPYRLQVGDVLDIKLQLNPELNEEVTIRPDGMISTTVAEDIKAFDRTPTEVSDTLRTVYSSTLSHPKLSVIVHSFAPNRVYVAGEVVNAGEFVSVGPNLTLLQAISRAGGMKLSAAEDRVLILRRGPNDVPQLFAADYAGLIAGRNPGGDVRLAQYDVVFVPRSGVYHVFTYWNQFVQQFLPVTWGFSYNVCPKVSTGSTVSGGC